MAQVLACPKRAVNKLFDRIPVRYLEALEHNQKIASCCRHPENHDIEAWYSTADERWRGKDPNRDMPNPPDIYIFHCTCGRKHPRFCVGGGDTRPYWEVR